MCVIPSLCELCGKCRFWADVKPVVVKCSHFKRKKKSKQKS